MDNLFANGSIQKIGKERLHRNTEGWKHFDASIFVVNKLIQK